MKKTFLSIGIIIYITGLVLAQGEIVDSHGITVASTEGVCFRHVPYIAWNLGVSDFIIFACYILIPWGLWKPISCLPKTIAGPLRVFGYWTAGFVASCGITHFFKVYLIFYGVWDMAIYFNWLCAVCSIGSLFYLWIRARPILISLAQNLKKLMEIPELQTEVEGVKALVNEFVDDSIKQKPAWDRFQARLKKIENNVSVFEKFRKTYQE